MWFASSMSLVLLVLISIGSRSVVECVTVTHHDKPAESKLPAMATKMKQEEEQETSQKSLNVSLPLSERQKRLLPYMNFYLGYNFNQPNQNQKPAPQIKQTYEPHKYQYETPIIYQQKTKFTPFLESNALPGRFHPMSVRQQYHQNPIKFNYVHVRPPQTEVPNYSLIYDKLSQLKLQQQQNFNQGQYLTENFEPQKLQYVPVRPNKPQQLKTTIQTYSPTNIDVPTPVKYVPQVPIKIYVQETLPGQEHPHRVVPQQLQYIPRGKIYIQPQKYEAQEIEKPAFEEQKNYYEDVSPRGEKIYLQSHRIVLEAPKGVTQIPKQVLAKPYEVQKPLYIFEQKPVQLTKLQPVQYDTFNRYNQEKNKVIYVQEKPQEVPQYHPQTNYLQVTKSLPLQQLPQPQPQVQKLEKYELPKYQQVQQDYQKYETATEYHTLEPQITQESFTERNEQNTLAQILKKLQDTNTLPRTLTPDNIDNSIRTLVKILSSLKKQHKFDRPIVVEDEAVSSNEYEESDHENEAGVGLGDIPGTLTQNFPGDTPEGGTPGKPGVDYPALSTIPQTSFSCKTQRYKGFFGDPDTHCQVWHYCDLNGGQASFLCPNGTIFSQVALTCDWWFNVKCSSTAQLYVLNERLYKYILPLTPKFPEDYSGPLVDRYLALKFKEMEEKMKKERKGATTQDPGPDEAEELQNADKRTTEEPDNTTTEEVDI